MKMPWKRRRSHGENQGDEKKSKQNQDFGSQSTISSILSIANLSRIFSAQFISNACNSSLKTPSPQKVCNPFNAKSPKPPNPNKCQKSWEKHPNKLGLSFIASSTNELIAMPTTELDDSNKAMNKENIVQRHQYVVIDNKRETKKATRSIPRNVCREEGMFVISPPSSVSYGYGSFYSPPSIFLNYCHFCEKRLTKNDDVYIYRGETAFCSEECRTEEIFLEGVILDEDQTPQIN